MKKSILLLALLAISPLYADLSVDQLADKVMKASGSENWSKVERVEFTFRVVVDGQEKVAAKHDWNIAANTDTVTWAGKTVALDMNKPAETEDEKAAFQRWTNDSYWLIAPLKLKDGGAVLSKIGEDSLEISFKGVGLTPGDRYIYQFDNRTHLPVSWTYMPQPDKKNSSTWEKYVMSGGLTLSTYHKMGNVEIRIDDLKVTAKP